MKLSIFTTIFIIFMVVVSPLYAVSILINIDGQNRTQRGVYDNVLKNINFYVSNIEHSLHAIVVNEAALINRTDLNEISRLDEIPYDLDIYKKLESLLKELQKIKESNQFVRQAYILFPSANVKITEYRVQTMNDFDRYCVTDSDFINGFPFSNHESGTYVNITSEYHMVEPQADKLSYIIVVQLNAEQIERDLLGFFTGAEDFACFIGDDYGLTIKNTLINDLFTEIASFISATTEQQGIDTFQSASLDKEMLLAYRKSAFLKTTFVITGERKQFLSGLVIYKHWTWILSAVTFFLLVIFTVWTRAIIAIPMNKLISAIRRGLEGENDSLLSTAQMRSLHTCINSLATC